MGRPIFDEALIHPAIRDKIAGWGVDIVREVQDAISAKPLVVVGMRMNPAPRKARRLLDAAGLDYLYLEYGPILMVYPFIQRYFVKGVLIGGASDLQKLLESGELVRRLAETADQP